MITNFEEITAELNEQEKELVLILIKGFKAHTGPSSAILSPEIVRKINEQKLTSKKVTGVRIRKMCNYIRTKGILPLIATSKGYYISSDKQEILRQIKSLNERANSIRNCAVGLEIFLK